MPADSLMHHASFQPECLYQKQTYSPHVSPPQSPTDSQSSLSFDLSSESTTRHQSETAGVANTTSHLGHTRDSAAKQAVCEMGIPEHIVQLAIDIHNLHHQKVPSVVELYQFALEIASSPELQASLSMEWHQNSLEEDGMECDSVSSKDVEESAQEDLTCSLAEMPASHESECAVPSIYTREHLEKLQVENKKLKNRKLCRVCRKVELAVSGVTFLPCGHFITCEECAEKSDDCPACGKSIMGTVRTFLS